MNIVFLGTPEIAKVCLEKLYEKGHKILAVVTNPDRPTGRGNKLTESPVKTFAKSKGLKVFQYESISKEGVNDLKTLKPDALVLVAFGQILSEEILSIAMPINLHGSLLPALRGPSPIQTAILEANPDFDPYYRDNELKFTTKRYRCSSYGSRIRRNSSRYLNSLL